MTSPWFSQTAYQAVGSSARNSDGFVTEMGTEKTRCNLKGKMMMIDHEPELSIPFWTIFSR
jgi:hypothetical protein